MSQPGEVVYYQGWAWRVAQNREEEVQGHYIVRDSNHLGVVVLPSGVEGLDTNEFDYLITWAAWYARPTEPRR